MLNLNTAEKRSIIAGLFGNALEWYDFLLYASFAPIFAEYFFPSHVSFISLMATFGVFAIGFLMRPLGGVLIGHYADNKGRRKALIFSVSLMTAATFCIGLLPTFSQVGVLAPILFTLLRLIQGLAVGGELPGSTTFLIEHMAAHGRGFAGSLVLSTAFLGIFIGSLTASILSYAFTYEDLIHWGWRIAYLMGGLLGVLGISLRIKSVEPEIFTGIRPSQELPAKIILTRYKWDLFLSVFFTSIMAIGNYVLIAYVTTFLVKSEQFPLHHALLINFIALFVLTLLIPLMGWLSDRTGRRPVFIGGLLSLLFLTFPIFWLLLSKSWWLVLGGEVLLSLTLAPLNATVPTIIAEMFPTQIRASGTSIGYNIGQALFGGTVPLVALGLIELTKSKLAPAWYLFAWVIVVLFASRFLQETYQKRLKD